MGGTEKTGRRRRPDGSDHRWTIADALVETTTAPPVRRSAVLEVGAVHDPAEHEADSLAARVVARLRAEEGDEGATAHHTDAGLAPVRRSATPAVGRAGGPAPAELSDRIEAARGRGSALDPHVRRRMGRAFGTDFSGVRVHTDAGAADAAAAMGAAAFTTGSDIFFGAGQYRPQDPAGEHVLAHELAHTVQQGPTRRKVSRLWDLRSDDGTDVTRAARIKVQKDRLVMFLEDDSGDTMVVKLEDQPIGLAALAGVIHKKLNGTETINYRRLPKSARAMLPMLLGINNLLDQPSWTARGNVGRIAQNWAQIANPVDRAVQSVKDEMNAYPNSQLLAMSVAPGEGADKANKRAAGDQQSLRALVERPGHVRELGRMTAIDMLLGNTDRVLAGNLGNWFYNPAGAMVMLDNVDSKSGMAHDIESGTVVSAVLQELADNQLATTAASAVAGLRTGMAKKDPTAPAWFDAVLPSGKTRKATMEAEMLAGLKEGKKYIVKVFSSTRRTVGGKQNRAIKKSIKANSQFAATYDQGANGPSPYYEVLKARAKWLAKH